MPAILSVKNHATVQHIMILIFCGTIGAVILGVVFLIVIRKQVLSRRKLHNLSQPDTEASKDYQVIINLYYYIDKKTVSHFHSVFVVRVVCLICFGDSTC